MNEFWLLLRNLRFHWRTNAAVLLGVVAATAAISGALVVGDSIRDSLRQMSLDRLGRIDHVLSGHRFFREELAAELAARSEFAGRFSDLAPALLVNGSVVADRGGASHRAGKVQVFGVDERLWNLIDHGDAALPKENAVVVNARLAEQLGVRVGDQTSLWLQVPSLIPRDTLLGEREGEFREIPLGVLAILDERSGAGRLSLNPSQQLPLNAFVPLETLQQSLELARAAPSRANPRGSPARVNALFAAAKSVDDQVGDAAVEAAKLLDGTLAEILTTADLGLRIVVNASRGYVSLESERQILEDAFASAGLKSAERLGMASSPVLAYLANELINAKQPAKRSMYSVVAGFDPTAAKASPFGPFAWASPPPDHVLRSDEIVVNDWLAQDLAVTVNDEVRLRYHIVGSHGELPEEERSFRVAGVVKLDATPAADPGLVPEVKGITDAKTLRDWDQPFPMKLDRITHRDEEYWNKYRATPKSFVSLEAAQKLWGSRYGSLTSVRVAPLAGQTPEQAAADLRREILKSLTPAETQLQFQPVKYNGVRAAVGSNDFSQLFLGFSFFLILAATILVGLLFRLGMERRGKTVGLLCAVGFTPWQLRRSFLGEGLAVVGIGGFLGTFVAVGYAELMIVGLKTWWNRAVGTQFLSVVIVPSTLSIGFAASVLIAAIAILWGLRQLGLLNVRELLAGETEPVVTAAIQHRRGSRSLRTGIALGVGAMLMLVAVASGRVPQGEAFGGLTWKVVAFFLDGMALLAAGVMFLAGALDSDHAPAVRGRGATGIARLGLRNAARNRSRSTVSTALIAAATFVIVAVAAGRRNPAVETPDLRSGNGGFRLVAESTEPILFDLNTAEGREKLDFRIAAGSAEASLLSESRVFPFRVKPGEDASCLNIYQTRLPTVLGVPRSMIDRGGFRFIGAREPNPWTLLENVEPDGSVPVFGDANTLQFSLHKGLGDTIPVPDSALPKQALKVAGMFDGSVFQGVVLMSEANFQRLFPDRVGYQYFLVETPGSSADALRLSSLLETQLAPYGFDAERVADRLAEFLSVQNTYLSTFQTLGGLGLLLGTLGLATVMIRNVLERRGELALMSAVGFQPSRLAWLVLTETATLLVWGLLTGTVAALVAMIPHLSSIGADVPWISLASILGFVFLVGMLAALIASIQAARTPVLESLRSE